MIKNNQKLFNRVQVLVDAVIIALSYLLSYIFQYLINDNLPPISFRMYMQPIAPIIILFLILNYFFHLYQPMRVTGRRVEAANIIKVNVIGALIIYAVFFIIARELEHIILYSRMMILEFALFNIVLTIAWRNAVRLLLMYFRKAGFNQKHILIVGYSRSAEGYIDRVVTHKQWGYIINGILDDNVEVGQSYRGVEVVGTTACLEKLLATNEYDEIVITLSLCEYGKLETIVQICEKSGVHTKFVPDYNNIIPTRPYTEDLLGMPVVHIRHVPLIESYNRFVKRSMDLVGSLFCILLFSPIMLITAIAVKLSSPGPLIFKQERVGLHNRSFMMYKFRSMTVQKQSDEVTKWTTKNDVRVTGVGKIIRKTSIDELPQLFNVLMGDMSLVGPRPERPFFVEKFKEEIPRYMVKHQVRPGMTGWAQVNGYRGDTSIKKRIEHDLYYIENWSIGFDIKILFLTVFRGFINKNAY